MKTHKWDGYKLNCLLSAFLFLACGTEPGKPIFRQLQTDLKTGDQGAKITVPALTDPTLSRVLMLAQPEVVVINSESTLRVPQLRLALQQADFSWVLRCDASYKVTNALGQEIVSASTNPDIFVQQMRWAWQEALGTPQHCVQVARRTLKPTIEDLGAPNGLYYYLINPCVSAEKSVTKKEECSYHFIKTDPIQSHNSLSKEFIAAAQRLSDLESIHSALLLRLRTASETLQLNRQACENNDAVKRKQENFWKGLGSLLATGIGAMAGGIFSGGTSALQGARAGLNFALSIFGNQEHIPLQCPILAEIIKNAQEATSALPAVQSKSLAARIELSKLNSEYARIDEKAAQVESTLSP